MGGCSFTISSDSAGPFTALFFLFCRTGIHDVTPYTVRDWHRKTMVLRMLSVEGLSDEMNTNYLLKKHLDLQYDTDSIMIALVGICQVTLKVML